jgi:hypothetical protein
VDWSLLFLALGLAPARKEPLALVDNLCVDPALEALAPVGNMGCDLARESLALVANLVLNLLALFIIKS